MFLFTSNFSYINYAVYEILEGCFDSDVGICRFSRSSIFCVDRSPYPCNDDNEGFNFPSLCTYCIY